ARLLPSAPPAASAPDIYSLSLHDALPIYLCARQSSSLHPYVRAHLSIPDRWGRQLFVVCQRGSPILGSLCNLWRIWSGRPHRYATGHSHVWRFYSSHDLCRNGVRRIRSPLESNTCDLSRHYGGARPAVYSGLVFYCPLDLHRSQLSSARRSG